VRYKDFVVSSTRVRRLIAEGRVDEAGALLGHHYFIDGTVVPGVARGRTIGFPTANIASENELLPPHGVYATTLTVDDRIHAAVTNIGVRPTFEADGQVSVETHLLDVNPDLYGSRVRLAFVQRLRGEQTFDGVEALTRQIAEDVAAARSVYERFSL
jgi:riboflavin kinase / FMN adenylyltransferase